MRRALYVLAITLGLVIAGTTGAVADRLINSSDVANGSLRGVDIHDGTVRTRDLGYGVQNRLDRLRHRAALAPSFGQWQRLNREVEDLQQNLCYLERTTQVDLPNSIDDGFGANRVNTVLEACDDFSD